MPSPAGLEPTLGGGDLVRLEGFPSLRKQQEDQQAAWPRLLEPPPGKKGSEAVEVTALCS